MYNEIMETNGFLDFFFFQCWVFSLVFNAEFPRFLIKEKVLYILLILIIKVNLLHMSTNVLNVCTQNCHI